MRLKNIFLILLITIWAVVLAACTASSSQGSSTAKSTGTDAAETGTSLSQVNMLLVGTLTLEDTPQAVTADEAANLLPLWQAYRSLSNSQTAAEAEVDALLNQIQSTMTGDQVQAIQSMNLTSTDMMNLMQSMGAGMGPQGTPDPQSIPDFNMPGGGFSSGNPPSGSAAAPPSGPGSGTMRNPPSGAPMQGGNGGVVIMGGGDAGSAAGLGGGPMLQGTQDPSMQATAQARFSTRASQVNTILLDMLITKLEGKTSG